MPLDNLAERPETLPELAANKALDAVAKYLREHGRQAVQVLVLVEMSGKRGEEVTGATAMGGSRRTQEDPNLEVLHALLTHARLLLNQMDGPPVTPELLAELLTL